MASASVVNFHNPFLKSNPFYRPQKFYSQDKLYHPSIEQQFSSNSGPNHSYQISTSIKTDHNRQLPHQSYNYSKYSIDQQISMSRFGHAQKERNLAKRCINKKQNPFLRKNLMPLVVQDRLEKEVVMKISDLQERHRKLFNSTAKGRSPSGNDELIINITANNPTQMFYSGNKENQHQSRRSSVTRQKQSSKRLQVPTENKAKYLSSEFKIKLKSQTLIEAQDPQGTAKSKVSQTSMDQDQASSAPATFQFRGKVFFRKEVKYRV